MFSIIIKEIKEFYRSPVSLFMAIVFPALLVFFLGTMLQNLDVSDWEIGEINIQYSASQANEISAKSFDEFLSGIEMVKSEKNDNKSEALELTDKGEIKAYIELSDGEIVLHTGDDGVANRALVSLLNSYIAMSDMYVKIAISDPSMLNNIASIDTDKSYVEQDGLGLNRSMLDYYGVCMAVMMIFMSHIIMGCETFKEEQKMYTMARLVTSPLGKMKLFFGKMLGLLPSAAFSNLTIMVLSAYVFGAHYCDNFGGNLLLFIMLTCCSMAAIAIGILIGFIIKVPAVGIVMPFAWAMLFFSGSFSKEVFFEDFSNNLPPYLVQQAAFNLTLYNDASKAIAVICVALAITFIASGAGAAIFSKKRAV